MIYLKRVLVLLFATFISLASQAQVLSGTYTIDKLIASSSTNFATFTEAITALNTNGVDTSLGVVFEVADAQVFNERPPALIASGGVLNRIIFKKAGSGLNPIIKPDVPGVFTVAALGAFGDGVFRIAGADNILIENIDIDTNANYAAALAAYDYGFMLLRRNATDACKNITIRNGRIQSMPGLIHTTGVFSGAFDTSGLAITAASEAGRMENVWIKGMEIWNAYHGIQLRGFNHTTSPNNLYDHFISVDSNRVFSFGGLATESNGIYVIYADSSSIKNNTVHSLSNAANIYGIRAEVALNAHFSIIANSVTLAGTSGIMYPIFNNAGGTGVNNFVEISYNKIFNCNTTGSSLYGIRAQGSAALLHISFNEIYNNTNSGTGATYLIWSIPSGATQSRVFNNKIYNNTVLNSSNNSTCYPFICNSTTGSTHVFNNEIFNITHIGAGAGALIVNRSNAANFYCYNNFISRLYTPNATGLDAIRAIELNTGANQKVLFNTVYLDASSNSTLNYGNSALFIATGVTAEVRNNIIINRSNPGLTGGFAVVYRRSTATLTSYDNASNNNCFYTDTTFTRRAIYSDGTSIFSGFAAYQTLVGPNRDSLSFCVLPPFINILTAPYDLRLSTLTSPVVAAGSPVSTPLITQDIFGNIRSTTNPDIGAYEVSTVLPVQLSYFRAYLNKNDVFLNWSTALEINNKGFFIERSADGIRIEPIGFVSGYGNSNRVQRYAFTDENPFGSANVLYYRLKQIDFDAVLSYSPVVLVQQDNNLLSNAVVTPNPFTSEINIECNLSQSEVVQLQLFSMNGTLVSEQSELVQANNGMVHWDNLEALPLGIYFLRIRSANQVQTIKMIKQ